jgi:hypothetical protein
MAINIITSKIGDSVRTEDVNRLYLELCRKRIFTITPGVPVNFHVLSDTTEGYDEGINIIPFVEDEDITNPKFHMIKFFDEMKFQSDTNVLWDVNLQPLDLCQQITLNGFPEAGDVKEADDYVTDMDIETAREIRENMLPFIQLPTKWYNDGSTGTVNDWFIKYNGNDCRGLYQTFLKDPKGIQEKYNNLAEFIENEFKGVMLPTQPGIFSPYYVNNKEKNDDLSQQWEENVRPYFPESWSAPGGEEDAPYIEWEHEYRDMTKQVKFLYFNTNNGTELPESDRYLLLWFL